jgi:asparagine synthase (glutamine-hydrolysing)
MQPQTAADVLPAVQASFDEPTAANSAIPLWYLSRAAAEHVKVVLCGEGGDELFLGYNRQRWARRMAQWRFGAPVASAIERLPELPIRQWNYVRQLAGRFREGAMLHDGYERFFASVSISTPELRSRIYQPEFFRREEVRNNVEARAQDFFPPADRQRLSDLEEFMMGDLTVHMPASMCQRLDRSSMAHSLEARVPFLSHRFVEFALTVPTSLKLKGNTGKYVLRKAVEPWLPQGQLDQRKIGFQLPLADWFMGGFNDFAREAWTSSGAADLGILDKTGVDRLFQEHRSGAADHGRMLYAIAMFSCWWKDQQPASTTRRKPRTSPKRSALAAT